MFKLSKTFANDGVTYFCGLVHLNTFHLNKLPAATGKIYVSDVYISKVIKTCSQRHDPLRLYEVILALGALMRSFTKEGCNKYIHDGR